MKSNDIQKAIKLIIGALAEEKYDRAVDIQGRLIVPNAQLMALQLIGDRKHPAFDQLASQLQKRLEDYSDPAMSGPQRRFLMQELKACLEILPSPGTDQRLVGSGAGGEGVNVSERNNNADSDAKALTLTLSQRERGLLPLLAAEELAARFVELKVSPKRDAVLQPSPLPGIWQLALPYGRMVALWSTETIVAQSASAITKPALPGEVTLALRPPNDQAPAANVFYSLPAGKYLPNWQLTLSWGIGSRADAAANRRIVTYLWTGIIVIAAIGILAGFMAQVFRNQMRYARLKNDLVATVSHELKTPLSSVRLLVDTLLDEKTPDTDKTRDYLQLIAKENARLSRLIDNFLAFSRMERNKYAFQFTKISLATAISEAVASIRERFQQPGCRLEVDAAADLPPITADADALVTVVINLLDNAFKYTGDEKHIVLRAYAKNGNACIAVSDNGVGLSRSAAKKVFDRFYQVDRRLSRSAGGCGLGLSIVKFIVTAHGGSIEVASRPGLGSTFTVKLPCNPVNV